jgi:hypothetical protein
MLLVAGKNLRLEKNGCAKRARRSTIVVLFVTNVQAFLGDKGSRTMTLMISAPDC